MKTRKLFLTLLILLVAVIAMTVVACDNHPDDGGGSQGPESGTYYCVSGDEQYSIVLYNGNEFSYVADEQVWSGTYSISEGNISFTFGSDVSVALTDAKLGDNYITLVYDSMSLKFWKNIKYTVTFDPNNGETEQKVTVRNGETLTAPDDPTLKGNAFLGWFKDDDTPFGFDAEPVTKDMTLKAKWRQAKVGSNEFTVKFEVGDYEGAEPPEVQTTKGGTIPVLTEPTRDGYNFQGWWVSYYENASKLAYRLTTETVIKQNMTVYALWMKPNENPMLPEVSSEVISWNNISGVSEYSIEIRIASDDRVVQTINNITNTTSYSFDWSQYAAGDYAVEVKNKNGSETRYFRNKALDRVSLFEVTGNTLKFNKVDNATNYYLDIDCGDENHKHDRLDNGPSTTYNFENCPMDESGKISFRVTATAPGYAESVSEVYEYERILDSIEKWDVDEENEEVIWEDIPAATGYKVKMRCANENHEHTYNGIDTSISYKECAMGKVIIEVSPIAKGYGSPAYTRIEIQKTTPSTPTGVKIDGYDVTWNKVTEADSYRVQVNDLAPQEADGESYNFEKDVTDLQKGDVIEIRVTAIKDGKESLPSDVVKIKYNALDETIKYYGSTLYWTHVVGASSYIIKVNGEKLPETIKGVDQYRITLTKEGSNTITLGYIDEYGVESLDEVTITVEASKVILNSDGGNINKTLYKAAGDDMTDLPVPQKEGYTFGGWYNVPGGANSNGIKYEDKIFGGRSIELYADWRPIEYSIEFVVSPNEINEELPQNEVLKFGESFNLPVPVNTDGTMVFVAWAFDQQDVTSRVCDSYGNSTRPWNRKDANESGVVRLYPIWEKALEFSANSDGKSYTVMSASGGQKVTSITIPAKYNDLPVTIVGSFADSMIETLNIPNTIQLVTVNSGAFDNCRNLKYVNVYDVDDKSIAKGTYSSYDGALVSKDPTTSVMTLVYLPHGVKGKYTIPEGIAAIGYAAASGAEFTELIIPFGVNKIDIAAFRNCRNLKSVIFNDGNSNEDLVIYAKAFENCTLLKNITLSKRLKLAGVDVAINDANGNSEDIEPAYFSSIFGGCNALENVSVSTSNQIYRSVGGVLFSKDLKKLVFYPHGKGGHYDVPNGTITIGENAFMKAPKLTSVKLADTVQTIENGAFDTCEALRSVYLGTNLVTIGNKAFYNHYLQKVEVASTVLQTIGDFAFAPHCTTGLGDETMADEEKTYYENKDLSGIVLPETVQSIGKFAFIECANAFKDLRLPNCEQIGYRAFFDCGSIENMYLDNVVSIDNEAFSMNAFTTEMGKLSKMKTVDLGDKLVSLGSKAFYRCRMKVLRVPATLRDFGDSVFGDNGGRLYEVENKSNIDLGVRGSLYNHGGETPSKIETLDNGLVFYKDGNSVYLVDYVGDESVTSVVLPNEYKESDYIIYKNAFADCKSLTKITIGSGVKGIQGNAFTGCDMIFEVYNLSKITINSSVIPNVKKVYDKADEKSQFETTDDGFIFGEVNNGYELLGYAGDPSSIVLPEDFKGQKYSISAQTFANKNLNDLTISVGVKSIPSNLFYSSSVNNSTLRNLIVNGDSGLSIGNNAFRNCIALETVTINNVTSIGNYAFSGCTSLYAVTLDNVNTVGSSVFNKCSSLHDLDLGKTLTSISMEAFTGCRALESLTIPGSVKILGNGLSYNDGTDMPSLKKVVIEEGVQSIGNYAFYKCYALAEVQLPESLTSLGGSVFNMCSSLTEMPDMPNVTEIPDSCFNQCEKLLSATISDKVTSIGRSAFSSCRSLRTVVIGKNVTSIATVDIHGNPIYSFNNCTSLKEVYNLSQLEIEVGKEGVAKYAIAVYDDLETRGKFIVDDDGFEFYESGDKVYLTNYVGSGSTLILPYDYNGKPYEIAGYAFYGRDDITSVSLSKNITMIGTSAFDGARTSGTTNLKNVDIPEGLLTSIGERAFAEQKIEKLTIPNNIQVIKASAFDNNNLLSSVTFGSGLERIEKMAFNNNKALKELIMPDSLEFIGNGAFRTCDALAYVVVGKKVKEIEDEAFFNCKRLVTIVNMSSLDLRAGSDAYGGIAYNADEISTADDFITIDGFMFKKLDDNSARLISYTGADRNIEFPTIEGRKYEIPGNFFTNNLTIMSVTIPDCVTAIGERAFSGCNRLEKVVIGKGVKSIGAYAFQNCSMLNDLTFVELDEVPEDYQYVIGEYAFQGCIIENLVIPNSITDIGNYAFDNLRNLKTLIIGDGVQTLGNGAFRNASKLRWVVIGKGLTSIGQSAFTGMTSLKGYYFHGSEKEWNDNKLNDVKNNSNFTAGKDIYFFSATEESGCWHYDENTNEPVMW